MARLGAGPGSGQEETFWSAAQTVAQFRVIAWLRWRVLVNGFRRSGGASEMVGRFILYPIAACFALLPILGAGGLAFYFAREGALDRLSWLLWATFIICQLLNVNVGQPGTTFDPRLLIRFPMRARTFVAIRLFFGLLSPSNVVGSLMSLAIAVGVAVAMPALWLYALLALGVFAAANVLFTRMVFAWVDRWLATRRAREIFTALIFAGSLGVQYLNVNFNSAFNHGHNHTSGFLRAHEAAGRGLAHRLQPVFAALPPHLTAASLGGARAGRLLHFAALTAGCAAYAAVFLLIFALRMRTEFRGETLSDAASAASTKPRRRSAVAARAGPGRDAKALTLARDGLPLAQAATPAGAGATAAATTRRAQTLALRGTLAAVLGKELLYLRRNVGLFYGLVAPAVLVFLFAGRLATHRNTLWIFPVALAYTLLSIVPFGYNSFGLEGAGAQFYFMAPVRLRDVVLAKNLLNLLVAGVEIAVILGVVTYLTRLPPIRILAASIVWAAATMLLSLTIGNLCSISKPKRIEPGRMKSRQTSSITSLLSLGILLACAAIGGGWALLTVWQHVPWALVPGAAVLLVVAVPVYVVGLRGIDAYAATRRESFLAELGKGAA